ncbi:MAG: DUF1674 domain-containing protein [Wenzhouxiangellaceae bacterium]|nr:DUF1674 domain-containing protein [Wenzhouxiangellaceae bacterium]
MNDTERRTTNPDSSRHDAAEPRPDSEEAAADRGDSAPAAREIGGRKGPDPVRYGDWEKDGRCIDF